jgi:superfamily II DNA/RNA helicase
MEGFEGLGTGPFFIERLKTKGITEPTAVQRLVMPKIYSGEKLIFSSPTGTGKTFAYLIPLIEKLEGTGLKILVCAPSYELCSQIKGEADFLLEGLPFKAMLCIGSANISRQIDSLKKEKPALLIGNPGRVLQLVRMGKLKLSSLTALVLDEGDRLAADELLAESAALHKLIRERCAADFFVCAGSATMKQKYRDRLLPFFGSAPQFVECPGNEVMRDYIEHWAIYSEERKKIQTLISFLAAVKPAKALVFIDRGERAGKISSVLQSRGIAALCLFAAMDKKARRNAVGDFKKGRAKVLVTSDLSARGLDIPAISHVIALNVPSTPDAYIHRAGRTARAGKKGVMVSIGNERELPALAAMEKKLGIVIYPKALYRGRLERADIQ